jgi:ankyrin repeat protein
MIFKFSGYETLTQESLILKLKELEDNLPFAKLFNQFLLLIEKGKEVLFEELLQEEEKNFSKAGKNIVDFLNVKHSLTGNTLLIYAVQNAEKNIVHSLLKRKCDPNIQNIFGNTALHMAYKLNNFSIVYLLKQNGASDNVKNKSGYTPYQMAFLNEHI